MEERDLREIALGWINLLFAKHKKHMDFEIFHSRGPLSIHIRRKFHGPDLTSIPNYDRVNVEPDIGGIIVSPTTDQKLWVIAEVKGNEKPVSQDDRRQTIDYAQATNAFRAFVISDGPLGADVAQDIKNGMHSFTGMFENGQKGICYLDFIRYLERKDEFVKNIRQRS
jgi:hypothetical protein